jgi:pilus biogenesis lipoprotein CpaD
MQTNIRMLARTFAILSVCLAGGLASGCLYTYDGPTVRREPQPELLRYRHVVEFPAERFSFEGDQGRLLEGFLTRVEVGYGDRVYLQTGSPPEGLEEAAASRLAERRTEAVLGFLRLHDIGVTALLGDDGEGAASGDTVTVFVHRYVVGLPACPDWTQQLWENQKNRPTSNWSCATATNFGMMVADPGDLVRGGEPGLTDGERIATSIERYRTGETAPLMDNVGTQDVFQDGGSFRDAGQTNSGSGN